MERKDAENQPDWSRPHRSSRVRYDHAGDGSGGYPGAGRNGAVLSGFELQHRWLWLSRHARAPILLSSWLRAWRRNRNSLWHGRDGGALRRLPILPRSWLLLISSDSVCARRKPRTHERRQQRPADKP